MTVNVALVLIVAILSPKNGWTDGTSEMVDMIFSFKRRNVRTAKSTPAVETEEIQATEVIGLT